MGDGPMTGERLLSELRRRRPDGDCYVAGYTVRVSQGCYSVGFLRYQDGKGIVGHVSLKEMARIAPALVAALKADGDVLKAYLAGLEASRRAPLGLGSSSQANFFYPKAWSHGGPECNGDSQSVYARRRTRWVPGAPAAGSAGVGGNASAGGFRDESPYGARGGAK